MKRLKILTVDTTVQEKAVYSDRQQVIEPLGVAAGSFMPKYMPWCKFARVMLEKHRKLLKANKYAQMPGNIVECVAKSKHWRTYLGRVVRDIERKIASDPTRQGQFAEELSLARRLLKQQQVRQEQTLQPACSTVECLALSSKRYEFGVKVSIAVTNKSNFVVKRLFR